MARALLKKPNATNIGNGTKVSEMELLRKHVGDHPSCFFPNLDQQFFA